MDGTGDVGGRLTSFKQTFRIKFNNWWQHNGGNMIAKYAK